MPLTSEVIKAALKNDAKLRDQFARFLINGFVIDYPLTRWCPGTDCELAALATEIPDQHRGCYPVECFCSTTFCFACGDGVHTPVSCVLGRSWLKRCEEDHANKKWIAANTKVRVAF